MKWLWLVVAFTLNLSYASGKTTLDDLDDFVKNSGGPRKIFNSRPLTEEYFLKLSDYFEGKLLKISYKFIVQDLIDLIRAHPEFESLLWRSNLSPSVLEFRGLKGSEEKEVNDNLWLDYIQKFRLELSNKSESMTLARAIILVKEYESMIFLQEQDANSIGRKQRKINFYQTLNQDPDFLSLINFLANEIFSNNEVQANLRSGNFEIVSDQLIKFSNRNYIKSMLIDIGSVERISRIVIEELPRFNVLKNDKNFFPSFTRNGKNGIYPVGRTQSYKNYRTIQVQPLHALFTGAIHRECSGGDPSANDVFECLLSSRWGLSLLPSTNTQFFEIEGKYNGVLRFIPYQNQASKLMSLDIMVPEFNRRFKEVMPDGKVKWSTVFDLWLEQQLKTMDLPLVVSQSMKGTNAGNTLTKMDSSGFSLGKNLGPASKYHPSDSMLSMVLVSFARKKVKSSDRDTLETELGNFDAGDVIQLKMPQEVIYDPKYILELASRGDIVSLKKYIANNKFPENLAIYIYERFLSAIKIDVVLSEENLLSFRSFFLKFRNGIHSKNALKDHLREGLYDKAKLIWLKNSFLSAPFIKPSLSHHFNNNAILITMELNLKTHFDLIESEFAKVNSNTDFRNSTVRDFYLLLVKLSLEQYENVNLMVQALRVKSIIEKSRGSLAEASSFYPKSCILFLKQQN